MHKATLMSLMSIALVVIVFMLFVPFMQNWHMGNAIEHIEATYAELDGHRLEFTSDQWDMRIASFTTAVHNFERDYPKETERIEKFQRYVSLLLNIDPDDPDRPLGPSDQEMFNAWLIEHAKDEIIDILEFLIANSALNMRIRNPSDFIILQVEIMAEGFDAEGNSLGMRPIRTEKSKPILSQTEEQLLYTSISVWGRADIASARIVWLNVDYGRNADPEQIYFQPVVCEVLWP
jgi:hypothetical protein